MRILFIISLLLFSSLFAGCAHAQGCKKGQIYFRGHCLWPGKIYTEGLNGEIIE